MSTPTTAALARSSASRSGPASSGGIARPASPLVTSAYVIRLPAAVHLAMALAAPYSRSSGWATIANPVVQSSGIGSKV